MEFKSENMVQKIKRIMLVICAVLTVSTAFGQWHHKPAKGYHALIEELGLNEDQKSAMEEVFTDFRTQMQALRDKEFDTWDKRREAMQELHDAFLNEAKSILTEAQFEKLEALRPGPYIRDGKRRGHQRHRPDNQSRQHMRKEIRAYIENEITPVLLEARKAFDPRIDARDQKTLDRIRPFFDQRRKERQERMAEHRKKMQQDDRPGREEMQKHRKARRTEREAFRNTPQVKALERLVEKYDPELTRVFEDLAAQHRAWKVALEEIHKKYAPDGRPGCGPQGRHGKRGPHVHRLMPEFRKGHFLLMDPDKTQSNTGSEAFVSDLTIYPNPSSGILNVSYTLESKTTIRLELRNQAGGLTQTLDEIAQDTGQYQLQYQLDRIPEGVYYLHMLHADGRSVTRKVVITE